jgi:uncharacterized protein
MKTPMKANGSAKSDLRDAAGPVRVTEDRLTLRLHVQPGARTTEWAGRHGDAVRLRVAARAVDGQANQACIDFIAESAGVARSAVTLVRGERSRGKLFRIDGISPARVQMLLEACGL